MDSKYPAWEWVLIITALGIFFVYHGWFFFVKTGFLQTQEDKYYGAAPMSQPQPSSPSHLTRLVLEQASIR